MEGRFNISSPFNLFTRRKRPKIPADLIEFFTRIELNLYLQLRVVHLGTTWEQSVALLQCC